MEKWMFSLDYEVNPKLTQHEPEVMLRTDKGDLKL